MAEGRHVSTTSARIKPAFIFAGAGIVLVAVLLFFTLRGGGGPLGLGGGSSEPVPKFSFRVDRVTAVPTRPGAQAKKLTAKAKPVAEQAAKALDSFYTQVFLDPNNWKSASYDDAFQIFDENAGAQAKQNVDTLTAGMGAGDAFTSIQPSMGSLKARVLLDAKDQPFSVVAVVQFVASGSGKDGSSLRIQSRGQYIFQKIDGEWRVVSFRVLRNDQQQAAASSSTSASPSGSPS